MLAFLWLMFTVRLITATLDCGYIANPLLTTPIGPFPFIGAIPLNVCLNIHIPSTLESAFKLSCDNGQVIVRACGDDPLIGDYSVESQTNEFNCDSQNECDYLYVKTIGYSGINCNSPITFAANFAGIPDICITTSSGSNYATSCDLSGVVTVSKYTSTDCTGTPNAIVKFSSNGNCNNEEDGSSTLDQVICPTNNPSNNPTNNPTNTPTTN
eukprot:47413_1